MARQVRQTPISTNRELKVQRGQRYILETDTQNVTGGRTGTKKRIVGYRKLVLHDPPEKQTATQDQLEPPDVERRRRRMAAGGARVRGKASSALTIGSSGRSSLTIEPARGIGLPV